MASEGFGKMAIFDQNSNLQTLQKYLIPLKKNLCAHSGLNWGPFECKRNTDPQRYRATSSIQQKIMLLNNYCPFMSRKLMNI